MNHQGNAASATNHQIALGGALLALICALLAVFASTSQAAPEPTPTFAPGAFFGSQGSEPGQFNGPRQVAAEKGSGNLLVTDSGNGRVQVLSVDASANVAYLTDLGAGTLITPVGIAVDPGNGAIYVSDAGAGKVFRFTSDGAATPTYTLDATFTSPTLSGYASTLAVDPTTHDLLVADSGSQEVRRFDVGDGSQISAFNGSTSTGGSFTSLRNVAVDSTGTVFVVDEAYRGSVYEFEQGRVERFDALGNSLGQLQGITEVGAVGIDPSSDGALVGGATSYFTSPRRLAIYQGADSPVLSVNFPSSTSGGLVSVAASDTGQVWVLTETLFEFSGQTGIQPFKPADIPAAELGPISAVDATTAHVTGSVAPGTLSGTGTAHFEYSIDEANWTSTPDQAGIAGPGATDVSADLTGLRPNTAYSVRLVISNQDFSAASSPAPFATTSVPPDLDLLPVSDRAGDSAVLAGRVNPFGQQTTYHFEYGETTAYGKTAPAGPEDVAGNGYAFRAVHHAISDLQPSTTYHYRLVARNATGTSATPDSTFTTRAEDEPTRAYEQVTPVDKHGMIVSVTGLYMAEAAGNGIVYQVRHAYDAPDTAGSVNAARYAAVRSPAGWELRQLDVPQAVSKVPAATVFNASLAVSADFSHALVGSDLDLAPGGVNGVGNLYRRDLATGTLELVATGLSKEDVNMQTALFTFYGGSQDFSRIVFTSRNQLTPDAGAFNFQVYEWSVDGGLKVISTLPDGSPPAGVSPGVLGGYWPARNSTSADASRVYFAQGGLYLHEAGASKLVSPPDVSNVTLLDTTADGRFAAYLEGGGPFGGSLYRYDRETETQVLIGQIATTEGFLGMSDDGSSIFTGGPSDPLIAWHEGTTSVIGTIDGSEGFAFNGMAASPNGRYFAFSMLNLAQAYDTRNPEKCGGRCREVYVYDVQEQALTCMSCPADGRPPAGHAQLGATSAEFNRYGPPFVNDQGQAFFDTPTALVASDTNGRRDVYEYQDGEARLISPGTGDHDATFADVSANGDNVFFLTSESLVGQDQDGQPDIYDARVGGGISSQSPVLVPPCGGGDCRAPTAVPPAPPAAASEAVSGRLQVRHHKKKARHQKRKARHHKKKAGHKKQRDKAGVKFDRTIGK